MAEYSLAHIGINAANEDEARKAAELFCTIFGFALKSGNSSIFAGSGIEVMKEPYLGTNGHIAIGTPDVAAAKAELEARGYTFREDSAKYKLDGRLNAIYLDGEIGGFAVHLVGKG
ncbi:VOC family protein [Butyricicoccus sp. 1XD8-22]|nr:VOC family protein [Butyricicoccus sp. 1XD8-22]